MVESPITVGLLIGILATVFGFFMTLRGPKKIGIPLLMVGIAIVASAFMDIPLFVIAVLVLISVMMVVR